MYKDPRKLMKHEANFFTYYQQMVQIRKLKSYSSILEEKEKLISERKGVLNKSKGREVNNLKKIRDMETRIEDKNTEIMKMKGDYDALEEEKNFFLHVRNHHFSKFFQRLKFANLSIRKSLILKNTGREQTLSKLMKKKMTILRI